MLKDILDQYLDGLIPVEETINKILVEDLGNDYLWYYDVIQHIYGEKNVAIITKNILHEMRDRKLLF